MGFQSFLNSRGERRFNPDLLRFNDQNEFRGPGGPWPYPANGCQRLHNETFAVSAMRDIGESCLLGLVLWHKQAFALTNFKAIRVGTTSNDNYRIQATCTCKFFSTLVVNTFKKRGSMRVTPSSHVHWFPEQTFVRVRTYLYVVDPTHEYLYTRA